MLKNILEELRGQKPNLPNKFTIALGDLIRQARLDANLSQSELAKLAYFSQAAISQIEKGKRSVSSEEIVYLSFALNKPISYFFSMKFLNQITDQTLSILEQDLLNASRKLTQADLVKIIAQIKAVSNME